MTEQLSGHQIMDNKAKLAVEVAQAQAELQKSMDFHDATAMNEDFEDKAAQEARAKSPEAVALNHEAQQAIWGDEYQQVLSVGYVDAEGNALAVPAVAIPGGEAPTKGPSSEGKLAEIRTNPIYGKTQAERDQEAVEYEADVLGLVNDEGFSLSQAKLIMDKREAEHEHEAHLIGSFIADGLSPTEADQKARKVYDHKDEKRREKIKTEGILSAADWEIVHAPTEAAQNRVAGADAANEEDDSSEYKFPGENKIKFRRQEEGKDEGKTQLGIDMEVPGSILDLNKHEATSNPNGRMLLITDTEGNEYFVRDDKLYDVTASREDETVVATKVTNFKEKIPLKDAEGNMNGETKEIDYSKVKIGEVWEFSFGKQTLAPVETVEVATEKLASKVPVPDDNEYEPSGEDPFYRLGQEMGLMAIADRGPAEDDVPMPTIEDKIRGVFQRAFKKFNKLGRGQRAATGAVVGMLMVGGAVAGTTKGIQQATAAEVVATRPAGTEANAPELADIDGHIATQQANNVADDDATSVTKWF